MRRHLCALVAWSVIWGVDAVRADEPAEARAIIDRGIEALGGRERLEKYPARTWNEEGTYYGMGEGLPYTGEYAIEGADRFRMEIKEAFVIVLNGEQGWASFGGQTVPLEGEQLAEQKAQAYAGWVGRLTPLNDGAFTLAVLEPVQVADRPAIGVKVSRDGHRDVELYFDQENGRLVKSKTRVKDEQQGGREVDDEAVLSDYREIEGVQVPTKIVIKRDGKRFVEAEMKDIKLVEKLDDSAFAKPK